MDKKEKIGFFAKVSKFFKSIGLELKKVVWPTKKELINYTITVLVASAIIGAIIWCFDWVCALGLDWLVKK